MKYMMGYAVAQSDKISDEYICVNNFGYYSDFDKDAGTLRENGRSDYQILCIDNGEMEFLVDGEWQLMEKGTVYIYRPHEKQCYRYKSGKGSLFCWIHFTGIGIPHLLQKLRLEKTVYNIGNTSGIVSIIKKMLTVCNASEPACEIMLSGMMAEILAYISQKVYIPDDGIERVINAMTNDNKNELTNENYAKICGLSEYHFLRKFKARTGVTPHRYKISLIIEKAKDFLHNTDLEMSAIAEMLGFEDSLYFSRVFKKETGLTPKEFRSSKK